MKIADLFAEIGFNVKQDDLDEFDSAIKSGIGSLAKYAAYVTGAVYAVKKFTDASVKAASSLYNFRVETGLSATELQRFQNAAMFSDISANADDVTSSIRNLQSNLQQIRLGQGNTRPFYMFGVSAGQDALGVLEQLRGKMGMFDEAMTVNLLQEMGLGTEMLHVLRMTNEEFDRLANSYILSGEQTSAIQKMGVQFNMLGRQIAFAKDELVAFLSPYLADAARMLSYAVRLIIAPFEALGFIMEEVVKLFGTVEGKIALAALALLNLRRIMVPLIALIGGTFSKLILLFLAVEDAVAGMKGGTSLLTQLLELAGLKIINLVLKGIRNIKEMVNEIARLIRDYIVTPIEKMMDKVPLFKNLSGSTGMSGGGDGGSLVDRLLSNPMSLTPAGMIGQSIMNTFDNVFNITSQNPEETAAAISRELRKQNVLADMTARNGVLG